jgi:uncharacterized repeat protein (TIGR03803 family)
MRWKECSARLLWALAAVAVVLASANRVGATPKEKVIHSFSNDGKDGILPYAGLTLDPAGSLYGATVAGGLNDQGSVFRLTPTSRRWTEDVLHSFSYRTDGEGPYAGVTLDRSGNLYGTATGGGTYDNGTVFELTPAPEGWTLNVLHSFDVYHAQPFAPVVLDKGGNVYGTTQSNTIYKLVRSSGEDWTETTIYGFTGKNDGLDPEAGLTWDRAGNLYGTTRWGGGYYQHCTAGCGTVFKLSPTSGGHWKEQLLHRFNWIPGGNNEGLAPYAGVILDSTGNLYGTTAGGGDNKCEAGCGTVFKLTPLSNGRWKETILHTFHFDQDGYAPFGGLVMDKAGNLYGTTTWGGINNAGSVFKLTPGSNGKWNYSVLHRFSGPDGAQSYAGLIFDKTGKHLYGTTAYGGAGGYGVVFEITP